MNLTAMTIAHAVATERAAGEASKELEDFCGAGMGEEAITERSIRREAEKNAWLRHRRIVNEAADRFLREAGRAAK